MKKILTLLVPVFVGCLITLGVQRIVAARQRPSVETLNRLLPGDPTIKEFEHLSFDDISIIGIKGEDGQLSISVFKKDRSVFPLVTYSEDFHGREIVVYQSFDPLGTHSFTDKNCDGIFEKKAFVNDGSYYLYSTTNGYPAFVKTESSSRVLVDGHYYEFQWEGGKRFITLNGDKLMVDFADLDHPKLTPLTNQETDSFELNSTNKNIQEYQMNTIREGMPPLPIPLSKEMDDQLVKEGILPPQ